MPWAGGCPPVHSEQQTHLLGSTSEETNETPKTQPLHPRSYTETCITNESSNCHLHTPHFRSDPAHAATTPVTQCAVYTHPSLA